MGMVTLSVNGRRYDVTCGDGEEERLRALGGALDRRVRSLVASLGQVGEARLLLLTCLLLEDEVAEAHSSAKAAILDAADHPAAGGDGGAGTAIEALAPDLDAIIRRIEAVAGRLKPS